MQRRSLRVILLSLILLFAQQMAMTHALGHMLGTGNITASSQDTASSTGQKSLPHSASCPQCSSFASLGFALGTAWHINLDIDAVAALNTVPDTSLACIRTTCHFRSRAPPQLLAS
jgi:hypothetical protein